MKEIKSQAVYIFGLCVGVLVGSIGTNLLINKF